MKTIFAYILFLFSSFVSFAQSDTTIIYTDDDFNAIDVKLATHILKSFKFDKNSWILIQYNKNLELEKKETYTDALLRVRNGWYEEYLNGKIALKGKYEKNLKTGEFTEYDFSGQVICTTSYTKGLQNGYDVSYWPNGAKKQVRNYSSGICSGDWYNYYENGKVASKEVYDKKGKLIDSLYLDLNGSSTSKENIQTPPNFPGGIKKLYNLLAQHVNYPMDAALQNIHGTVMVSFTINEDGTVTNINVDQKVYPTLDKEALRVIKLVRQWIPATFLGKPTKIKWTMPVKFGLS